MNRDELNPMANPQPKKGRVFKIVEAPNSEDVLTALILNRIFWKLPLPKDKSINDFAEFIAAELRDAGITIYWDKDKEIFRR